MSKKVDFRFVCYSFACFAVLGVGVYFLHKWQAHRETGIFLAKAQEAESRGKAGESHRTLRQIPRRLLRRISMPGRSTALCWLTPTRTPGPFRLLRRYCGSIRAGATSAAKR